MNEPKDPEAAEPDQTTEPEAVASAAICSPASEPTKKRPKGEELMVWPSFDVENRKWFVTDRDRRHAKLRGPYKTEAEAAAVRTEMERSEDEERNLWIVWENIQEVAGEALPPSFCSLSSTDQTTLNQHD